MHTHASIHSPLALLAALGLLVCSGGGLAQDTAAWACKSCPYPKAATASIEAGVAATTEASEAFGTYTGLQRQGAHLVLGGDALYLGENGLRAEVQASRLGLDTRSLAARAGRDGQFSVQLGYSEIPRRFGEGSTPFLGVGGDTLTLPAGYPAASTSGMPLASTLQSVRPALKASRLDLSAALLSLGGLTLRAGFTHDVRDGTRPTWGSFFASTAQLVAPVNHSTDTLQLSATYTAPRVQLGAGVLLSRFQNGNAALSWANPFWPAVAGATRGQLALAPDNQLQQVHATLGLDLMPGWRASGDISLGRLTQDQAYLSATLNPSLSVPALPARSLDGRVDLFNANLKLSAQLRPDLRLALSVARDSRDNRSPKAAYPLLATDMFVDASLRTNTPFDITTDRTKLAADFRASEALRLGAGLEHEQRDRSFTEVQRTRETTGWAKAALQAGESLSLSLKLQHAERKHPVYGTAQWFGAPENPLLRKYNLADRRRDSASLRAEQAFGERLSVGVYAEHHLDDYGGSQVGLTRARGDALGLDVAANLSERTRATLFVQGERMLAWQNGAQTAGAPDWWARNNDRFTTAGFTLQHALIPDKLEVSADARFSRASSRISMRTAVEEPRFPPARTSNDSLRLNASYKLSDTFTLNGSFWHERLAVQDWQQGLLPDTLQNVLALGLPVPRYNVNVLAVSLKMRY